MTLALCIKAGAALTRIATLSFTLSWVHSVEKTPWEEDYRVTPAGLVLTDARIESTGAGMEMPSDSRFDGRFWHWTPRLPPLPELNLRRSDAVPAGYRLCTREGCRPIADRSEPADIVTLSPCPG